MRNVNPRLKFWNKYFAAAVLTVLLAGMSIAIYPEQKNLRAQEYSTTQDALKCTGKFIRSHKDLLHRAAQSLKNFDQPEDQIVAWIEGIPLTVGELEFRDGLRKSINPSSDSQVAFNILAEEKILLNEAVKRNVIPTSKEINEFLAKEKEEYGSNPDYRSDVDLLIKEWEISEAEYWEDYEWYNAFRIIMIDKLYEDVIKEAATAGLLPKEDNVENSDISSATAVQQKQKAKESYWNRFKLELKRRAKVRFNKDLPSLQELKLDPEKWYLS